MNTTKTRNGHLKNELLFVIVSMAALTALVVNKTNSDNLLSKKITSMKSDVKGTINSMKRIYTLNDNKKPAGMPKTLKEGDPAWNGVQFNLSKNNSVTINTSTCGDTYYTISVADISDPQLITKTIEFDSCTDSAARTVDN